MGATFADEPLFMEDPGGQYSAWMNRVLPYRDCDLWGEPIYYREGRDAPRTGIRAFVGLGRWNWRQFPPDLRLNTLWWPCTGATRWACGLFLVDTPALSKILAKLSGRGKGVLKLEEDILSPSGRPARSRSINMYTLSPRPINWSDASGFEENTASAWLLPLVDIRYWWQWIDMGLYELDCESDWETLLYYIANELGIDSFTVDEISEDYLRPDPIELTRAYENAAMVLDAVAACVGHRIVANPDGRFFSMGASSSAWVDMMNILQASPDGEDSTLGIRVRTEGNWRAAGGSSGGKGFRRAEVVTVVYPRWITTDEADSSGRVYAIDLEASAFDWEPVDVVADTQQIFFDTAKALIPENASEPTNYEDLLRLAQQIAVDYWNNVGYNTDISFYGMCLWEPSGWDDWIWWHWGYRYETPNMEADGRESPEADGMTSGLYACYTRVTGLHENFGLCELLHQLTCESSSSSSMVETSSSSSSSSSSSMSSSSSSSQSTSSQSTSSQSSSSESTSLFTSSSSSTIVESTSSSSLSTSLFSSSSSSTVAESTSSSSSQSISLSSSSSSSTVAESTSSTSSQSTSLFSSSSSSTMAGSTSSTMAGSTSSTMAESTSGTMAESTSSTMAESTAQSTGSATSGPCIKCFGPDVCIEDIPTRTTMDDADRILIDHNNCLYWISPTDCTLSS